jgi:hypothetical protein
MLRLTKFFITLPLLSLPLWGLSSNSHAEEMGQMDALRLLAKSRAADSKCKVLSAGDSDELNAYVARAEVAAAARHSVSEIQSTISVGRTLGATAACSDRTSGEIGATLAAARQAMAAIRQPKIAAVEDEETIAPAPRRKILQAEESRNVNVSLAAYGRHAFAYYVERRCEYLSRRDIRAFWVAIVREHKAALVAYGGPAVANTLRRARSQAEEMDCDSSSRQLVRAEYTRLARN